jgi:Rps23 Pro-64 3,4-dihydroxylase Tpa1-like proline 4-hydroxylase
MSLGQSTRWNAKSQAVETYAKDNVFTMQVQGGSEYTASPRLVEYIVEITKGLSGALNAANKAPVLQTTVQTNKLAVCLGDGSQYAKHYDNAGGIDRRKLTALYYMNPNWAKDQGGTFRAFPSKGAPEEYIDIEPIADRLLCFWSDELVHGVQPSYAASPDQHRYALTVWLVAAEGVDIHNDEQAQKAHFPSIAASNSQQIRQIKG